ncbi:hypothetical protein DL98DRAFT_542527 [Cadophora sp. DSE1049]|nr:hypothetical protein DL98DRAFT_542527 [Cadophora sp. DSE1049]
MAPSKLNKSESEEENIIAQVISESESEEENLKELGPDRLDREDIDESDAEIKLVIDLKGGLSFKLPFKKVVVGSSLNSRGAYILKHVLIEEKSIRTQERLRAKKREIERQVKRFKTLISTQLTTQKSISSFFKLKPPVIEEEEDIFEDIDSSDDEDLEFNALVEAEFEAEDNSIELNDLNDVEFIDSRRSELLLDSLISDVITLTSESLTTLRTYKEVLTSLKQQINNKHLLLLPRVRFEYSLIQQYV